jgi:hypothetical protein
LGAIASVSSSADVSSSRRFVGVFCGGVRERLQPERRLHLSTRLSFDGHADALDVDRAALESLHWVQE